MRHNSSNCISITLFNKLVKTAGFCNPVGLQGTVVPGKQRGLGSKKRFPLLLNPLNVGIKEIAADNSLKHKTTPKTKQTNNKTNPS